MLAPETTAFLEGGCSLVVATVSIDNQPTATRGWGLTILSRRDGDGRLLLDAHAARSRDDLATTGVIAVTAADVPTLNAIQLKGTVVVIEPATDADRERAAQFADAFFHDIATVDGTERSVLERLFPSDFFAVTARFSELYDQTPGPVAGVSLGTVDA